MLTILSVILNLLPATLLTQPAYAAGGAYTINFAAADPELYIPPIPYPPLAAPTGRGNGDTAIPNAYFQQPGGSDVKVESLAPDAMALGQIVPFEIKILVSGDTTPENGVIRFTAGWNIDTTNNNDFGYDESYGVYAAFVDTGDGAHSDPGGDATVDSFSWAVVGDEIQGTFNLSGLDDGDVVVVEAWLVLEDTIPAKVGGNVASRLISARTSDGDAISTGNQAIPLLQVGDFFKADADLSITKSDDPDPVARDGTLTYILVVLNSGPDIANAVQVVDTLDPYTTFVSATASNGGTCTATGGIVTCDLGAVVPGTANQVTITIVVTVNPDAPYESATGEDLWNSATVSAITEDPVTGNNTATEPTDVLPPIFAPDITVIKTADPSSVSEPGGNVTFSVLVENGSASAATLDSLIDNVYGDLNGQGTCSVPQPLAASDGTAGSGLDTYSCSFTVFVGGDAGETHTDTVTATASNDGGSDSATDSASVTFTDVLPDISISKTANPTSVPETGGNVTFTIVVTNNSLEDATIDSLVDTDFDLATKCPAAVGAVLAGGGGSYICEFSEYLIGDDLVAHVNTATVVASDDDGNSDSASDDATVTFTDVLPDIAIVKTANPVSVPETGGTVEFTIVVTNNSLEDATIDSLADTDFDLATQCPDAVGTVLASGASYTCIFGVDLANDDLVTHENTATVVASDNDGNTDTESDDETVTFTDVAPELQVTKSASPSSVPETGGEVTFTFLVENIGEEDVTLTSLTDTVFGDLNGQGSCVVPQEILIGENYSCSITVNLSADDLTAHTNVATATAVDDDGTSDEDSDDETVTFIDVAPEICLTKSASPSSVPETGGDVTFTFLVENIGEEDVTLTSLTDTVFGDLNGQGDCATGGVIPIGDSYSCSITVNLSADDLADHTNVATAVGTDDDGTTDEDSDDETVTFTDVAPEIRVTKSASPSSVPETGGEVTFTFLVENIGKEDVTLTSLTDTVFGDLNGQGDCATGGLIPIGDSYSCSITVNLSADDLAAHTNVATAVGTDDDGTTDEDSDDETVTFTDVAPEIRVTKSASPSSVPETGGDVTFTFLVENIGEEDVTLTSLTDTVFGDLNGQGDCATGGVILIGDSYSCLITANLSADDLAAHTNVATAVGTDDDGTTDEDSDDETVTFEDLKPDVAIVKTANPTSVLETGGTVEFTIVVTNHSLEDATIDSLIDSDFGLGAQCPDAVGTVLAYGESYTCVFSEWIEGDVSGAAHVNVATILASDNDGNSDLEWDDATVEFEDVLPDIAISKTADPTSVPETGGTVEFTIVVTNNSLEGATIDSLVDSDFDLAAQCPDAVGTVLASGESYTCVFSEFVAGDYSGPAHENTATVVASDNDGNTDAESDDETVTFEDVLPDIAISKTADPTSVPETGGTVEFTIVVTNNGLEGATIDSLADSDFDLAAHCPDAVGTVLTSGESYTCGFSEFIAGDYSGPAHENTATVVASDNDGNTDAESDDETVTFIDVLPDIAIVKTADPTFVPETGGDVEFTIVVTNHSLEDAAIDSLVDSDFDLAAHCADAVGTVLASGESYTCVFSEFISGDYSGPDHQNTATVEASDNDGNTDTESDDETVTLTDVLPDVTIAKTADPTSVYEPGADVEFTIVVTNNSLEDATIDSLVDSDFDLATHCPDAVGTVLAYGESYTCILTEFIAGNVGEDHQNTATVVASDNDGNTDTESDSADVTILNVDPSISVNKTAGSATVPPSGAYVEFIVQVTNNSVSTDPVEITSIVDNVYGDVLDPINPNIVGTTCAAVTVQPGDTYTCGFTVFVAGGAVGDVLVDEVTVTGEDDEDNPTDDSDTADVTVAEGDGVGTPGYWKNKGSGLIPDVVLIGDWNQNGTCDAWESCIELTKEQALYLLDASNYNEGKDKRYTLARSLVAAWLNVSVADNDFVCIEAAINDGIAWLYTYGLPPIPGDHPMESNKPIKGKTWSQTGEPIYLALDEYNNTGGGCAIDRDTGTR